MRRLTDVLDEMEQAAHARHLGRRVALGQRAAELGAYDVELVRYEATNDFVGLVDRCNRGVSVCFLRQYRVHDLVEFLLACLVQLLILK